MKKPIRNQKSIVSSYSITNKYSGVDQINLDGLGFNEKEEIDLKLKEIDSKIEDIGRICDKKKLKSYDDYNNILKSNKSQFMDELTKLNFKLIETIKQNTREDFLIKLRKDLGNVKNQVYEKDKELQSNNNKLYVLENKVNLLQEEKDFVKKEIRNSKHYNLYLKNKLKELEKGEQVNKTKNETSFENTSRILKSTHSPVKNKDKQSEKLESFFEKNEEIIKAKISHEEKGVKEKYNKLKVLESFKNQIFTILENKIKDYKFNQMNSRVSNQEVFFNIPENDLSSPIVTKKRKFKTNDNKNLSWDYGMTKTDKKEIIKTFLEDTEIKKYIFDTLYDN